MGFVRESKSIDDFGLGLPPLSLLGALVSVTTVLSCAYGTPVDAGAVPQTPAMTRPL